MRDRLKHGISFVEIGRVATAYYFGHFLVLLPFIGRFEKTRPLPDSIVAATGTKS